MSNTILRSLNSQLTCPKATPDDLLNDTSMLLSCVIEKISSTACQLGEDKDPRLQGISTDLFGTLYLAEIASQLLGEGHTKVLKADGSTNE